MRCYAHAGESEFQIFIYLLRSLDRDNDSNNCEEF